MSRSDSKVYRSGDNVPSGRLSLTFADGTRHSWAQDRLARHWHDRQGRNLEQYLGDAMGWLTTTAVAIGHRLAEEAEAKRRRAEPDCTNRAEREDKSIRAIFEPRPVASTVKSS